MKVTALARLAIAYIRRSPFIQLGALIVSGFVAIAGGVKAYRDIFGSPAPSKAESSPNGQGVISALPVDPQMPISAPLATKPLEPYAHAWSCIVPPAQPKGVSPLQYQLDDSLLYWVWFGTSDAHNCVSYLLSAGASPDAMDKSATQGYGSGPALHSALQNKQWANALTLLAAGADPNLRTTYKPANSPNGRTALDVARYAGADKAIRDEIIKRGGKVGETPP